MPADQLNITLIQPDIIWENKEANLRQYEDYISNIKEQREVVILPEMFTTGFSMSPERLAETMDGPSVRWMKEMSARYRCILTGSLIIEEDGKYYNRLIWMQPDGRYGQYDKRHLFAFAGEDQHYSAGDKRLIASVKGWKICLQICYDLRFPVWSRQSPASQQQDLQTFSIAEQDERQISPTSSSIDTPLQAEYDVLIYTANWPERRSTAWKTLLRARAIENMVYVAGVNRVGLDGNNINHSGDSSLFGPLGEIIWQHSNEPAVKTITLEKDALTKARQSFPFLKDADNFVIL